MESLIKTILTLEVTVFDLTTRTSARTLRTPADACKKELCGTKVLQLLHYSTGMWAQIDTDVAHYLALYADTSITKEKNRALFEDKDSWLDHNITATFTMIDVPETEDNLRDLL